MFRMKHETSEIQFSRKEAIWLKAVQEFPTSSKFVL